MSPIKVVSSEGRFVLTRGTREIFLVYQSETHLMTLIRHT